MLAVHVATSIGWMGAVTGFVAVAAVGLTLPIGTADISGVYAALNITLAAVIVPLALLSVLTGIIDAIGTPWGLFRHWWVVIKLVLTLAATAVLLLHAPVAARAASFAHAGSSHLAPLQTQLLVDAVAGLTVLTLIAVLGWIKPRGRLPGR